MEAIYEVLPEFVPKPTACGTYSTIPDTHFFLCEFRKMTNVMPDPDQFAFLLATLHKKSEPPTGKFGFHITTYAGNLPQFVAWEKSWEAFFSKSMRYALDLEIEKKGPSEELNVLSRPLFEKVIPRLLRPLESGGRVVKRSLVHGDLWYANAGIDVHTNQAIVFDACCFFAHNECTFSYEPLLDVYAKSLAFLDEFGQWRPACNKFGHEYIVAYKKWCEVSSPKEDFEGLLDLYRL